MKNTRSSEPYQFSNIRSQNKNEILEDYVEAIQEILKNKGDVKNADLAQHFGVSQATVNKNLKRLISFNLAKSEPYRSIFLTEKGEKLATQSKQKHEIVYNFLNNSSILPGSKRQSVYFDKISLIPETLLANTFLPQARASNKATGDPSTRPLLSVGNTNISAIE